MPSFCFIATCTSSPSCLQHMIQMSENTTSREDTQQLCQMAAVPAFCKMCFFLMDPYRSGRSLPEKPKAQSRRTSRFVFWWGGPPLRRSEPRLPLIGQLGIHGDVHLVLALPLPHRHEAVVLTDQGGLPARQADASAASRCSWKHRRPSGHVVSKRPLRQLELIT